VTTTFLIQKWMIVQRFTRRPDNSQARSAVIPCDIPGGCCGGYGGDDERLPEDDGDDAGSGFERDVCKVSPDAHSGA